jgi:hypothetical protein
MTISSQDSDDKKVKLLVDYDVVDNTFRNMTVSNFFVSKRRGI